MNLSLDFSFYNWDLISNFVLKGLTFSVLLTIVATLGGLFILKEKKTKKEMAFVIAGVILIALGGILIGITKNA